MYAATNSGIYRITDGGANWAAINSGLPALSYGGVAVDAVNPRVLYATPGDDKREAPRREEVPMVQPEVVQQIRALKEPGWGARRIGKESGVSRNTVNFSNLKRRSSQSSSA